MIEYIHVSCSANWFSSIISPPSTARHLALQFCVLTTTLTAMRKKSVRSPISDKQAGLRQAGQSLREQMAKQEEKIVQHLLVPACLFMVMWMEWFAVWFKLPRQPWIFTALFVGGCFYTGWRLYKIVQVRRNLRRGEEAERAVGSLLEAIGPKLGFRVYHDLLGDNFNVDHILIGPRGVFCIETKYRSKPARGQTVIDYDGATLRINGGPADAAIIIQAKAEGRYLRAVLSTDEKRVWAQPVVVFPGWYVKTTRPLEKGEVPVFNEQMLETYLASKPEQFAPEVVGQWRHTIEALLRQMV